MCTLVAQSQQAWRRPDADVGEQSRRGSGINGTRRRCWIHHNMNLLLLIHSDRQLTDSAGTSAAAALLLWAREADVAQRDLMREERERVAGPRRRHLTKREVAAQTKVNTKVKEREQLAACCKTSSIQQLTSATWNGCPSHNQTNELRQDLTTQHTPNFILEHRPHATTKIIYWW